MNKSRPCFAPRDHATLGLLVLVSVASSCSQTSQRGAAVGSGGTGDANLGGARGPLGGTGGRSGTGGSAAASGTAGGGGNSATGGPAATATGGRGAGGSGAGGVLGAGGTYARDAAADAAPLADAKIASGPADGLTSDSPGDRLPDRGVAALDGPVADGLLALDAAGCPAPGAGTFATSSTHLNIGVHDPAMLSDGKRFYLLATGGSLNIRSSSDGLQWASAGKVFASVPSWVTTALNVSTSGFELWAPDLSFFDCSYHVYYAGSTFGSNTSVIGLATSPSLDPKDPSYGWTDQGQVVQSKASDNFNAIDPNVAFDEAGTPWLSFGSFWDGIKLRKLDPSTGKPSTSDPTLYALASRKGTGDAIEAPSIVSHNGYYYLFVSFDACCKGVDSTYRTMVGRGSKITGPYTNKAGTGMSKGAAEELLASQGRTLGPGGGTAFRNGETYYYAFHYYDRDDNGSSKLQIRPIVWGSDDWPTLTDPLFP
jgi:arabinan endo-1,5-alpha-L-arabinosidase